MEKKSWNDDNSKRGIEGWYAIDGGALVIYVKPTNSFHDWVRDFMAWPVRYAGMLCHAGFVKYSSWLWKFILGLCLEEGIGVPDKIILIGYSMGGGVVQLTSIGVPLNVKVYNIAGPRVCSKEINAITYWRRGDIVPVIPFWFKQTSKIKKYGKCKPILAHADYDVNGIINNILKEEL